MMNHGYRFAARNCVFSIPKRPILLSVQAIILNTQTLFNHHILTEMEKNRANDSTLLSARLKRKQHALTAAAFMDIRTKGARSPG